MAELLGVIVGIQAVECIWEYPTTLRYSRREDHFVERDSISTISPHLLPNCCIQHWLCTMTSPSYLPSTHPLINLHFLLPRTMFEYCLFKNFGHTAAQLAGSLHTQETTRSPVVEPNFYYHYSSEKHDPPAHQSRTLAHQGRTVLTLCQRHSEQMSTLNSLS